MKPLYNTSQAEFYLGGRIIWENAKTNIAALAAHKAFYTLAYCDARIAELDAANNLKSDVQRTFLTTNCRIELMKLGKDCLYNWQGLKSYIRSAVAPEFRKANYNAAGAAFYENAGNDKWTAVQELMNAGSGYIADNLSTLTAHDNMPNSFEAKFNLSLHLFNDKLDAFIHAEETAQAGTDAKIEANNACYAQLMVCSADGQYVFKNNEAMRMQFSFNAVCKLISPAGAATAEITVKNKITNQALFANVEIQNESRFESTDAAGVARMTQLPAEETTFVITADGYAPKTVMTVLKPGTVFRHEVLLELVPMAVPGEMVEA